MKRKTKVSPFNPIDLGKFKDVEFYHCVIVHDNKVIRLNESHTTHVWNQVQNMVNSFSKNQAIFHESEIH